MNAQLDLLDLGHPDMPTLDLSRVSSRPVSHLTAARMVEEFHYAHRVPSIVLAVGMYVDDVLAGVLTYGIPAVPNVQRACGEEWRSRTLELNRLFIHDWAGRNSESWLIGQSFRWVADCAPTYRVLVSYADTAAGHVGVIYRATNWIYTGESREGCEGFVIGRETIATSSFSVTGGRSGNSGRPSGGRFCPIRRQRTETKRPDRANGQGAQETTERSVLHVPHRNHTTTPRPRAWRDPTAAQGALLQRLRRPLAPRPRLHDTQPHAHHGSARA